MEKKKGMKRKISGLNPFLAWIIICPILVGLFTMYAVVLYAHSEMGWAIYSLILGVTWAVLFGFHINNFAHWETAKKFTINMVEHLEEMTNDNQLKNIRNLPFEEFENKGEKNED